MVNFRYHVVSLVAVFLALGAGILVGSNVVSDEIVRALRADLDDFKARNAQLRAEAEGLDAQLRSSDQAAQALVPQLVKGKLSGRLAAIIAQEGVEDGAVDRLAETLVQAGSAKPARVLLTKKWMLASTGAHQELIAASGATTPCCDKPPLWKEVGAKLGARLGGGGDPGADGDLLSSLADAGFVRLVDVPRGTFPAPGSLVVTMAAGDPEQAPRSQDLLVPLVEALAANRPVVVGEPLNAEDSVTDRVRGERTLSGLVATVDHANTGPGRLSVVWAMRSLLDGGKVWHYGTHRGTDGLVPAL